MDLLRASKTLSQRFVINSIALSLLAACLLFVVLERPFRNGPPIRSDGVGYHAWSRAFLTHDVSVCDWGIGRDRMFKHASGRNFCQNMYPPGLAILRFPLMYWFIDTESERPTISEAEHMICLAYGAAAVWGVAALALWSAALLGANALTSAAVVLMCLVGTGLFHYGTYDSSFSHAYSALFCALLCAFGIREHRQHKRIPAAVLIACSFFLLSLRLTNVCLLAILCAAFVLVTRKRLAHLIRHGVFVALGAGLALGLQVYCNYLATSTLSAYSYGTQTFLFDRPMQAAVMFSYERGLFTYYPCFGAALIAGFMVQGSRPWAWLLSAQVACYVILYGYWESWMLGGGMGHRGFVENSPLVMISLCMSLGHTARVPRTVGVVAVALCSLLTTEVMLGCWSGYYPLGGANATVYWRQVRMLESRTTGGSACRASRCNIFRGRCRKTNEPEFTSCLSGIHDYGFCTGLGSCEPVVTLRSLDARNRKPYVVAAPARRQIQGPLLANSSTRGAWESFLVIGVPDHPEQVWLRTTTSKRYVSAPMANEERPLPLVANAERPGENETFTREGAGDELSLRASNGKYVSARLGGARAPLIANASEAGPAERFAVEVNPHGL